MLDVKRMRILKEVADKGSFSAAAESLSYTQSAVSQQIAALEREPEDSLPLLKCGDIDIALTIEPSALDESEGLDSTFLLDDPMFAAIPLDHPLARKSRVRLKDLANDSWIGTTDACSCGALV